MGVKNQTGGPVQKQPVFFITEPSLPAPLSLVVAVIGCFYLFFIVMLVRMVQVVLVGGGSPFALLSSMPL